MVMIVADFTTPADEVYPVLAQWPGVKGWSKYGVDQLQSVDLSGEVEIDYTDEVIALLVALAGGDINMIKSPAQWLNEKGIDISELFSVKCDSRGTPERCYGPSVFQSESGPVLVFGANHFPATFDGKKEWKIGGLVGNVSSYAARWDGAEVKAPALDLSSDDGTISAIFPCKTKSLDVSAFKIACASTDRNWANILKPVPTGDGDYDDSPVLRDWQVLTGDYQLVQLIGPFGGTRKDGSGEYYNFMAILQFGQETLKVGIPMNYCNSASGLRGMTKVKPGSKLWNECNEILINLTERHTEKGSFFAGALKKATEAIETQGPIPNWLMMMGNLKLGKVLTYRVSDDLLNGENPLKKDGKNPRSPKVHILACEPDAKYLGGVLDITALPGGFQEVLTAALPQAKDDVTSEVPY